MNLLGHALLSFNDTDILCGNLMGDYVKGKKALDKYPSKIREGLILHRKIDEFTDNHPAVIKAANIFKSDYHLYANPIIDIVFDHFLANDPQYFKSEQNLQNFTKDLYRKLKQNEAYHTERFKNLVFHLEDKNILFRYRNIKGYKIALDMLCQRMQGEFKVTPAWENAMLYYNELNQYYFDFIEDVLIFAKNEIKQSQTL